MAILRLMRGAPGSGKSTAAKKLFPGTVLFENDMFLIRDGKYCWSRERVQDAIKWCTTSVENALKNGMDVVVANTFTKRRFIEAYRQIAERYNAEFIVYRCTGNYQNVHNVSDELVESFRKAMEDYDGEIVLSENDIAKRTI